MIGSTIKPIMAALICLTGVSEAMAHDIPWPRGMSRQIAVGSCAKGPCRYRTSFSPTVPHKHAEHGNCIGMGAAGYTARRRFDCPSRK